jgi:hypothetical protein
MNRTRIARAHPSKIKNLQLKSQVRATTSDPRSKAKSAVITKFARCTFAAFATSVSLAIATASLESDSSVAS